MLQRTANTLAKYFFYYFIFRFMLSLTCLTSIACLIIFTLPILLLDMAGTFDICLFAQSKVRKCQKRVNIDLLLVQLTRRNAIEFLHTSPNIAICLSISFGRICFRRWIILPELRGRLPADILDFQESARLSASRSTMRLCKIQTNKFPHQALLLKCNLQTFSWTNSLGNKDETNTLMKKNEGVEMSQSCNRKPPDFQSVRCFVYCRRQSAKLNYPQEVSLNLYTLK